MNKQNHIKVSSRFSRTKCQCKNPIFFSIGDDTKREGDAGLTGKCEKGGAQKEKVDWSEAKVRVW